MLDTAGQLLERLLKTRLLVAIGEAGGLSQRQHGFRQGRSTIGAVQEVVRATRTAQLGNHYSRRIVLLVTLDVRNVFNTARWTDMLRALADTFRVPEYQLRMVRSYPWERKLVYETAEGPRSMEITGGAAHGSILGPDLWNVCYDSILRKEMPDDTFLMAYADDIAAEITAKDSDVAQLKLNQVMRRVNLCMHEHGLSIAAEKTEIVMLTRRRIEPAALVIAGVTPIDLKAEERNVIYGPWKRGSENCNQSRYDQKLANTVEYGNSSTRD